MQFLPPQEDLLHEMRRRPEPTQRQLWLAALTGGGVGVLVAIPAWALGGSLWWWAAIPIGLIAGPAALTSTFSPIVWLRSNPPRQRTGDEDIL